MVLQALSDRGVNVPYVSTFSTSSDPTFQKIANPNYYAIRSYAWPLDASIPQTAVMKAAAVKAGTDGDMTSNYFTQGYVTGELIAQALKTCGDSCTPDQLNTALEGTSSLDTAGLSAPVQLSTTNHALVTATKLYHWDASAKKTVAVGDYVSAPTK
jgi:ABC-type branched-subunit amino acid transport system substrate-binding protein